MEKTHKNAGAVNVLLDMKMHEMPNCKQVLYLIGQVCNRSNKKKDTTPNVEWKQYRDIRA